MHLTRVEVRHLRNLTSVSLSPSPGINIIEGRNGSGKTSLLESIHLIALARSFRTLKTSNIVQHGEESLSLYSELDVHGQTHRIGLQRFRDNRIILRLNGENLQKRAHLASLLPLLLITPDSIRLLTGSPNERRQFIDWTMFHVEHTFHKTWIAYQRALKQRNASLRVYELKALSSWDSAVSEHGNRISALRQHTLSALTPHIQHYAELLLPGIVLSLQYRQGWKKDLDLHSALADALPTDSKQKFTSVGPHRADIKITANGFKAAEHLSRGQLKLLLCAFKLGQMAYLTQTTGKQSIVLLDDLPAELDAKHRNLLLGLLSQLESQVFITATDRMDLQFDDGERKTMKVFHVEHGEIKEVV